MVKLAIVVSALLSLLAGGCAQPPAFFLSANELAVPARLHDLTAALRSADSSGVAELPSAAVVQLGRFTELEPPESDQHDDIIASPDGQYLFLTRPEFSSNSLSAVVAFDFWDTKTAPATIRLPEEFWLAYRQNDRYTLFTSVASSAWVGLERAPDGLHAVKFTARDADTAGMPTEGQRGRATWIPGHFAIDWVDTNGKTQRLDEARLGFRPIEVSPSGRFISGYKFPSGYPFFGSATGNTYVWDSLRPDEPAVQLRYNVVWVTVR